MGLDIGHPLCAIGQLYIYVMILRAVLSFFPISPDSGIAPLVRFLYAITEPILAPVRRIIPPVGMFDLSFLVVLLVLQYVVVGQILCRVPGI